MPNKDLLQLYSLAIAGAIITLGISIVILTSLLFWFGVTIPSVAYISLFLGIALSGMVIYFIWRRSNCGIKHLFLPFTISVLLIAVSLVISSNFYDLSWDGQAIHQEAVIQFSEGINSISVEGTDYHRTWIVHYPKANWLIAATIYKVSGKIEAGKAYNILMLVASFLLAVNFFSFVIKGSLFTHLLLAIIISFNTISFCQSLSYYQDGIIASLMICFISTGFMWFKNSQYRLIYIILHIACAVLLINLKFTAIIYTAVIGVGIMVSSFKYISLWKTYIFILVGVFVLGICLVGYSPYIRNISERGHIFYPVMSKKGGDFLKGQRPENFINNNRFANIFNSLFSRSENIYSPSASRLKLPFSVTKEEIYAFGMGEDVRVGGFGPLFGLAIVISHLILVLLLIKRQMPLPMIIFYVFITISVLLNPASWWARYAPQIWFIPVLILVASLKYASNNTVAYLNKFLILILFINIIMVSYPYTESHFTGKQIIQTQLQELKNTNNIIEINFLHFKSLRARLREHGVSFTETDKDKRNTGIQLTFSHGDAFYTFKGKN